MEPGRMACPGHFLEVPLRGNCPSAPSGGLRSLPPKARCDWHTATAALAPVLEARRRQALRRRCAVAERRAEPCAAGGSACGKIWAVRRRSLEVLREAVEAQHVANSYDWARPSWQNYADNTGSATCRVANGRSEIDWDYHGIYTESRCDMQDAMVAAMIEEAEAREARGTPQSATSSPCAVFSAGAIGVGKSYTVGWLADQGLMPSLISSVYIDPDIIARGMPEWQGYQDHLGHGPNGHEMCLKEAGLISELALWASLEKGLSVCVDSSLRDGAWHRQLFQKICEQRPQYRLTLLHVEVAEAEVVPVLLRRAEARAAQSGRKVPEEAIRRSAAVVPSSVAEVCDVVDLYVRVHNGGMKEGSEPYIAGLCARDEDSARLFSDSAEDQKAASARLADFLWRPVRR
ncbi:unnamed protein product [Effrenium voratum]|uniref:Zeta toxin domain-containing protein n=1 Tax=Effrenium voratum TaxID=2562239 RepID=A0AA36IXF1_9DINO|nr:unnamed protein product [Effrenium voratum]CAJ1438125.1 unnamed protein product [Effrenium voratum]